MPGWDAHRQGKCESLDGGCGSSPIGERITEQGDHKGTFSGPSMRGPLEVSARMGRQGLVIATGLRAGLGPVGTFLLGSFLWF